ncbi:hypothetical protein Tco_0522871 [Tanacetum coccineum]
MGRVDGRVRWRRIVVPLFLRRLDWIWRVETADISSRAEYLYVEFLIFEHEHVVMNPTSAGMRHHHLHLYGFPAPKRWSSNTDVLDLPMLASSHTPERLKADQHVNTSLIHIESCKSPTAVLFDDDTGRISIRHCEY